MPKNSQILSLQAKLGVVLLIGVIRGCCDWEKNCVYFSRRPVGTHQTVSKAGLAHERQSSVLQGPKSKFQFAHSLKKTIESD